MLVWVLSFEDDLKVVVDKLIFCPVFARDLNAHGPVSSDRNLEQNFMQVTRDA